MVASATESLEAGMGKPERRSKFIDREVAAAYGAGDIGPCAWKGLCGRPGNREYAAKLAALTGEEWAGENGVFYCAVHTDLVVQHAERLLAAHRRFLESDRMLE